jgi:PAS domain S-box-containing protein
MYENAMTDVNRQAQSSLADFELLAEVSQLLTVIDLDHVLERVITLTARAVGATNASLFLHHAYSDEWQRLLTSRKLDPQESVRVVQSVLDKGMAGWVVRNRRGGIVDDTETDERWHTFANDTTHVRSALCLPLMRDEDVLAVLTLVHTEPYHFTEHHLRLLTIIANQASVAIRNAQLFNQMQEQQRQLEATFHAIPDALLVVNDEGNVLLANDAAADLLGDAADVLAGEPLGKLIQRDTALSPLQRLIDNPGPTNDGRTFESHSDRRRQDFVINVSRWENTFGNTAGHVVVLHNVTTLRDLDRFKSEMLKMASHDLRSPLALIVGYCDLIRLDLPPDSAVNEYLDVVTRSTRRMSGLLDDLLRVEEIRTSPIELHKPTNFRELVDKALDNLYMMARTKNQIVSEDIQLDGLDLVTVDPVLIREAMENLVSNAAKYTREGGEICVKSYYDDWRVHFVVEDNGIGIPQEDLKRIFEWGFRSKRSSITDQTIEGRGLGLALVKTVLERHRGEVWVESQEGVGSRFGFWLPI